MELVVGAVRPRRAARITQLINKTNQFNLTTRRYTEDEVPRSMADRGRSRCSSACSTGSATTA